MLNTSNRIASIETLGVGRCWPVTGTRNRHNPYSARTSKCLKFIGSGVERVEWVNRRYLTTGSATSAVGCLRTERQRAKMSKLKIARAIQIKLKVIR